MKRADIKVWFSCNNFCEFCVQWDKRFLFKPRSLEKIKEITKHEYDNWCREAVFTWWEPTVHPKLVEAVSYASSIWYKEIQIQSNWTNFDDINYCKSLINAWVTQFWPSIHWANPSTHDDLVKTKWAWKRVVKWVHNLKRLRQAIIFNIVVTKKNYRELPKLSKILCELWVSQLQFAFVHILWSADKNKVKIVPKKTDVMPYIKKWIDIWNLYKIPVFTEAIPYCLMQWYEYAIAENIMPETTVIDAEHTTESYKDYRVAEWKVKVEKCKTCKYFKYCEWPWKEYPEIYWWDEFEPIK